ncbi:MAG: GNAT family N-acetyltransferase, partial [Promethearchaeota archaeon]
MTYEKGYSSKIDDQFSIHIAKDTEEELKALIKLNVAVHKDEILETFIHRVFLKHPRKDDIRWLYIRDNRNDKLVSTICLVPLEWQIQDVELPVCEMEFVGTLEEYRGNNFVKILNDLYENIMEKNGYILSVIRGIPYFYRNLGYEYLSSLDDRIMISVSKIPQITYKDVNIRKANSNDLSLIE